MFWLSLNILRIANLDYKYMVPFKILLYFIYVLRIFIVKRSFEAK